MNLVLTIIFIITTIQTQTFGQNSNNTFAKRVFKSEYKRQSHSKFGGQVVQINEHTFRYGDKILIVDLEDYSLISIFSLGIFHPEIIDNRPATKPLTKAQLDTLTESEKVFYNLARNDTTRIGDLEELKNLNPDPKTKRFVFWLHSKGMINPTECYFELRNIEGTKDMPIEEFIKNSKLIFYYRRTIII